MTQIHSSDFHFLQVKMLLFPFASACISPPFRFSAGSWTKKFPQIPAPVTSPLPHPGSAWCLIPPAAAQSWVRVGAAPLRAQKIQSQGGSRKADGKYLCPEMGNEGNWFPALHMLSPVREGWLSFVGAE